MSEIQSVEGARPGPGRLLLVSNRLPVTVEGERGGLKVVPSVGGLASALWPEHERTEGVWLGWTGRAVERGEEGALRRLLGERRLHAVALPKRLVAGFYEGFSNRVLWPLVHYLPHAVTLDRAWWSDYREANRLFAEAAARLWQPGDRIWVHDYHLMLLPAMLRRRLPEARIGFFLHTPFPSSELFRILPWRRQLLLGMTGADLIGFHSFDYLEHFRTTLARVLGNEGEGDLVVVAQRAVRLGVFPIGIDAERYRRGAVEDPAAARELEQLRADARGRRLVLGVDRMDYTKGIPERLLGYERFLERYPSQREQVEFLQIGVPTRTEGERYQELKRRVDEIVGRVNGRFGTPDWTPVKYIYRPVPFTRLCALYRHASVALVTPLRDGMNLVAKEFVACHRDEPDAALVLSEFAGAAAELAEALLVNPYDPDGIAEMLHHALAMPRAERRARMTALATRVWEGDVNRWAARFLASMEAAGRRVDAHPPELSGALLEELGADWRRAGSRMILLDYEGTLTNLRARPELARPGRELLVLLAALSAAPNTDLAVMSGHERGLLARWLGGLPMTLVAEHGRWLRHPSGVWEDRLRGRFPTWLQGARRILDEAARATPGSRVEVKSASVAWSFRRARGEAFEQRAREALERLAELEGDPPPDVVRADRRIEVRVQGVSKASSLVTMLAQRPPVDFILAAGDNHDDDELFAQLPAGAWSVAVGLRRRSRARACVAGPDAMRRVLADLIR